MDLFACGFETQSRVAGQPVSHFFTQVFLARNSKLRYSFLPVLLYISHLQRKNAEMFVTYSALSDKEDIFCYDVSYNYALFIPHTISASSRIRRSLLAQPRQGSVMERPYTPPPIFWLPSSK